MIDAVKKLRDKTNAGIMDCKIALKEADGDIDKAIEILRKKGKATASKKAGRIAKEGCVESYIHLGGKIGVLVEVNCETDFVARNEEFRKLVKDIAMQIAAAKPAFIKIEDVPKEAVEKEKEIYREQIKQDEKNKKKPSVVLDKIVESKLQKFYEDCCLLEQLFIRDQNVKVKDIIDDAVAKLGENIVVRRFSRFQLGEEL